MKYAFTIPGKPTGKGRPRFGNGRTYTPAATLNAEQWVKHCALMANVKPIEGPVRISVRSYRAIPKSWSRAKREFAMDMGFDTRKPDADNLLKLIADALNGIAYGDDAQIVDASVTKHFSQTDEEWTDVILMGVE